MNTDVHDERRTRRLAALVEHTDDLVGLADAGGGVLFLNRAARERLGVSGDVTRLHVRDFYTPETWAVLESVGLPQVIRSGSWHGRGAITHRVSGAVIEVDMTVFRLDDPADDDAICYATIQRDVTAQVGIERELQAAREREQALGRRREQAEQLHALTRASIVINSAVELEDILDRTSTEAAALIGARFAVTSLLTEEGTDPVAHGAHLSGRYAAWRGDATVARTHHLIRELLARGSPIRLLAEDLRTDPSWSEDRPPLRGWLAAPLTARDGRHLGVLQLSDRDEGDFTETDEALLVQLAQIAAVAIEKARLYEVAAEQEAARFREDLLAGISHDMQTPLAAITGLSDLLTDGPQLGADERDPILSTLARQSRNLHGLVQQFLDYSRLEADRALVVRPRPLDVVECIDRVVEVFEHQREIVVGAAMDLPEAVVDPERLDQVLTNLVSNAIKFSEGPVRVVAREQRGLVVIDVVDEGRGIPPEDLEGLFQKFHRGSNVAGTPGTGLGLYITHAIVGALGGRLEVKSRLGEGSRFTLSLPTPGMA